jgi:hypothetical protein
VNLHEVLREIVERLDDAGVAYMLAGSVASSLHGEPRSTRDIDLVIEATPEQLGRFVDGLDRDRWYVGDAMGALARLDQFNVIDVESGWKVDLIVRKDRPFSHEEFERRCRSELAGVPVSVASPEDTLLSKLEWAHLGGSERQIEDAATVLRQQGERLDHRYLDRWSAELGVTAELARARRLAGMGEQEGGATPRRPPGR